MNMQGFEIFKISFTDAAKYFVMESLVNSSHQDVWMYITLARASALFKLR